MSWQNFFLTMTGGQQQNEDRLTKEQRRFIKFYKQHGVDEDDAEDLLRKMGVIQERDQGD